MENRKEEKKGKKTLKTLLLIAGTVAICYEAFARKGQDVKNAWGWVKDKVQSRKTTRTEVDNNQRQNKGDWNNKQRRNN